jgi:hypothetical protein
MAGVVGRAKESATVVMPSIVVEKIQQLYPAIR